MTSSNLDQTIEGIESYLDTYTKSLNELRTFINQFEQLDIFYKTINKDINISDISSFKNQLDFTGFLTISILDLLVISKNIMVAKYQWERIYQLKLGYLTIYEAIRTYHRHKEINSLAKDSSKTRELFSTISSDLKTFKSKYEYPELFTEIRNATIAHIDTDFKTYYDTISKINGNKYFEAILSFLQIIFKMQELSKYLSDILLMQKDGEPFDIKALMKEMSDRINENLDKLNSR